jgi:hypothetical protein
MVKMNYRKFETTALALLLALSCSAAHATHLPDDTPGIKTVLAIVGERPITREDIIHMIQIEKFYKSPPLSEADALFIVMQDAIAHEVAHSVGIDVTPSETPINSPFVDQFTPTGVEDKKAQGTTPLHEQPFHVDHGSYAQLYVVPKIIDRKLRRYYSSSSYLHRNERESINQALQLVMSGKSFAEAANQTGLMTTRHELEHKEITLPATPAPTIPLDKHLPKKDTIFEMLDNLAPGEIHPNIIQYETGYHVVRLISRNGNKYTIETIDAVKPQYEDWLNEQSRKLDITISNDALRRDVKRDYPGIDWVERLQ